MDIKNYSLKDNRYIMSSIILILFIWQITSVYIDNKLLFPSVIDVFKNMISIINDDNFIIIVIFSIVRAIKSFIISLTIAMVLAIGSNLNKIVYNMIFPIVSTIKAIPTMAFIVLLLIWTSKDYVPIIIGVMISLPILYDTILGTLVNLDKKIIYMCMIYRVSIIDKIKEIIIPVIMIEVGKILSSTWSLIFKVVISGEVYS